MYEDKTPAKTVKTNDTDDTQMLVEDFLELSELSLNKLWLTPEVDQAWKEL